MNQIYRGGCQCGAVLYEVELDPSTPCASVWQRAARPGTFKLLSGEECLSGYQFWAATVHHFYCERCGQHAFSRHGVDGVGAHHTVDLRALDALLVGPTAREQTRERRA